MTKVKPSASGRFRPPEAITDAHDLIGFDSGEPSLDDWLRRHALKNQAAGGSRTYVVRTAPRQRVAAYYGLAAGAVARAGAPSRVRRNMPDPIPVIVIGRLAVDRNFQGRGLGRAVLRDAVLRVVQAASIAGVRAILVHALSEQARQFYEQFGFHPSPIDPMTLMVTIAEAEQALSDGP